MMQFTDFLKPELVQQGVAIASKKRALEMISQMGAEYVNQQNNADEVLCAVECFSRLFQREKLGSTCLNNGIALPHAKVPMGATFTQPIAIFLQLQQPIDCEAADNRSVDLIFAMLFPENHCEQYKTILPQLAQQLADKAFIKQLRAATSVAEIWQVFEMADHLLSDCEE